jgi:Flp pilus assembly protein TadD
MWMYQGQLDQALTALRRAEELAPHDPGTHAALAKVLAAKGMTEEAQSEMQKAREAAQPQ